MSYNYKQYHLLITCVKLSVLFSVFYHSIYLIWFYFVFYAFTFITSLSTLRV